MNKRFCSIPVGYKDSKFGRKYEHCGGKATHKVKNSDWYICSDHVEYANEQKWGLEKLKETN